MSRSEIEAIVNQVERLTPEEQVLVMKRITDILTQTKSQKESRYLVYGQYQNATGHESTEEDFKLAEWHGDKELVNGE